METGDSRERAKETHCPNEEFILMGKTSNIQINSVRKCISHISPYFWAIVLSPKKPPVSYNHTPWHLVHIFHKKEQMAWRSPMHLLAPESSLKEQPLLGTHCAQNRGQWRREMIKKPLWSSYWDLMCFRSTYIPWAKAGFRANKGVDTTFCLQRGSASPMTMDGLQDPFRGKGKVKDWEQ